MASKSLNLNKVLKLLGSDQSALVTELRKELREERRKSIGIKRDGGGDFHVAFWADAKWHVRGVSNLLKMVEFRIERSSYRKRLYPLLARAFLSWFDEVKRGTNLTVGWKEASVHNHLDIPSLDLTLKVDNLLCLQIGADSYRIVYPYFSEYPILTEDVARIGLWAMSEALPDHSVLDMEILDVLRGRSFRGLNMHFKGNEEALFSARFKEIVKEWDKLRPQYDL